MRDNNEVFQLIDVREIHEAEQSQIGGLLIPMGEIMADVSKIFKRQTCCYPLS